MDNLTKTPHHADLLLSCLQTSNTVDITRLEQLSATEWQSLAGLAQDQGVASLLYHNLKTTGAEKIVPKAIWQQLARQFKHTALRNMRLLSELYHIVKDLDKANIPVIALKGAYLAPVVYPDIGMRPMKDLDLLIPIADILRAADIIKARGYQFPRAVNKQDLQFSHTHHLPQMAKDNRYFIELHGRLTIRNESWSCDPKIWWQETQTVCIHGQSLKVLNPIYLILHLCIHISYHHNFVIDLRHYYDLNILMIFLGSDLDWKELIRCAHLHGWGKGVFLVLKITRRLFGLELPEKVLNKLEPERDYARFIGLAVSEMWTSSTTKAISFTDGVAEYQHRPGIRAKLDYLRQRIFIPKELMAKEYPLPVDSLRVYPYYLVRIKDLFFKHRQTLWQMSRKDPEITATATRKHTLRHWLNVTE